MKCCICGVEMGEDIKKQNNPDGYIDPKTNKKKQWPKGSKCCQKCNLQYVVKHRILPNF